MISADASMAHGISGPEQEVGKTQRLFGLRLTDELPHSAIGKVQKRKLREAWG